MYEPREDSFFFYEFLNNYLSSIEEKRRRKMRVMDMGSGSGILAECCAKFLKKENILCVDIQEEAINLLKKKGFIVIKSNLFEKIPKEKFDLIIFNPPYLPLDKREPKSSRIETTGGKKGDELILKFLKESKRYLKKEGKIFLLISSLTPLNRIKKFKPRIVAKKKIWFEELKILEIRWKKKTKKKYGTELQLVGTSIEINL
ncbi:MAG: methyltransferase [Candidatus Pacearchaeota archaeon]